MMRHEFVEVFSSEDAREEAERHRRDLADTLDALGERIGGAVQSLERQVMFPIRWAAEHPLPTLGLSLAAGLLLGARAGRPRARRSSVLARELEGAYLQGRRDEIEQRPPRDPEYWSGIKLAATGPDIGALLFEAAKPLLARLTSSLVDNFQNTGRN